MSISILRPGATPPEPHQCALPERSTCIRIQGQPHIRPAPAEMTGAVVRCDVCGQTYHAEGDGGFDPWWWPVTDRAAKRLAR